MGVCFHAAMPCILTAFPAGRTQLPSLHAPSAAYRVADGSHLDIRVLSNANGKKNRESAEGAPKPNRSCHGATEPPHWGDPSGEGCMPIELPRTYPHRCKHRTLFELAVF